jgi:hypothetical protein
MARLRQGLSSITGASLLAMPAGDTLDVGVTFSIGQIENHGAALR